MDESLYNEEKKLLLALERKEAKAFKQLHKKYGEDLVLFTYCIVNNLTIATRIVERLFEDLWTESKFHLIEPPIYKFLVAEIRRICSGK